MLNSRAGEFLRVPYLVEVRICDTLLPAWRCVLVSKILVIRFTENSSFLQFPYALVLRLLLSYAVGLIESFCGLAHLNAPTPIQVPVNSSFDPHSKF